VAAFFASRRVAKEMNLPWFQVAMNTLFRGRDVMMALAHFVVSIQAVRLITETGDTENGVQFSGQVQGLINDLPTAAEVIQRTIREAEEIHRNMGSKFA